MDVVNAYFNSVAGTSNAPVSGYSSTGRGYPDVSLFGHSYQVVIGGNVYQIDGTSASCPVMAAFLSLINAQRKAKSLSTLGFVQPLLYSTYSNWVKNDITSGNTKCCHEDGTDTICCSQGYNAVPGWDPATGLGSVNFASLAASLNSTVIDTSAAPSTMSSTVLASTVVVAATLVLKAFF